MEVDSPPADGSYAREIRPQIENKRLSDTTGCRITRSKARKRENGEPFSHSLLPLPSVSRPDPTHVLDPPNTPQKKKTQNEQHYVSIQPKAPDSLPAYGYETTDMEAILDALMAFHTTPPPMVMSFQESTAAIQEALSINQEMQRIAEAHIKEIKQQIQDNEELAKQVRMTAAEEHIQEEQRSELHKKYDTRLPFLRDQDNVDPQSKKEEGVEQEIERSRSWHPRERERLFAAIHSDVKNALFHSHRRRHEYWRMFEVERMETNELELFPVDMLNWDKISLKVGTRSAIECLIQWTSQEHPSINKKPWTKEENAKLKGLVEKYGIYGHWEQVAIDMKSGRTASQCFSHHQSQAMASVSKHKWTEEDDEALKAAVEVVGERNWQQVALVMGQRSGQQCLQRWKKSIDPAIRRSRWTGDEDKALLGATRLYGEGNWSKISLHIPGRTDMQCRERYTNVLDPKLIHKPFSCEERQRLQELVVAHGNKWSLIARHMPGRTDNQLLRVYKLMQLKAKKHSSDQNTT
ncbi:hypothetical protein BDF14DRAFT_1795237 [Spinellus fusiger]|nr:hypothetical protein BDF14DRAFT_1795237 [Spinellus fusiger]